MHLVVTGLLNHCVINVSQNILIVYIVYIFYIYNIYNFIYIVFIYSDVDNLEIILMFKNIMNQIILQYKYYKKKYYKIIYLMMKILLKYNVVNIIHYFYHQLVMYMHVVIIYMVNVVLLVINYY